MRREMLVLVVLSFFGIVGAQNNTCVENPTNSSCVNYNLPDEMVYADVLSLCDMMGNMSGCAINRICQDDKFKSGFYCTHFGIYKELCEDMPMKPYCNDFEKMCIAESVVRECATKSLPLPSSNEIANLIKEICSDMEMPGCEQCAGKGMVPCDVLTVYSDLCLSMPDMKQCADWKTICSLVPTWPICTGSGSNEIPEMRMYFHTSIIDYVLFKQWVPRTSLQYIGTWFAIFFLAVLYDALRYLRYRMEQRWSQPISQKNGSINEGPDCHEDDTLLTGSTPGRSSTAFRWHVDPMRAILQFVETAWSLLLMLVAMTFNVGLFFALCSGAAVGVLIFGRFQNGTGLPKSHH